MSRLRIDIETLTNQQLAVIDFLELSCNKKQFTRDDFIIHVGTQRAKCEQMIKHTDCQITSDNALDYLSRLTHLEEFINKHITDED